MGYTITPGEPAVPGTAPTLILADEKGNRAEVWPAFGFNCFRWQAVLGTGQTVDVLYSDPAQFVSGHPTRTGIPVLFPFPNRIRDGRFTWAGREYRLPANDPSGKNAIHGFAVRRAWQVIGQGADDRSAWVTGEFALSMEAPDLRSLWPADPLLRLTLRLSGRCLRLEAEVVNLKPEPLPFGLGYHPYFRVPFVPGTAAEEYTVKVPARSMWKLEESLPDGTRLPVDAAHDLNRPRPFSELKLDDVLTDLPLAPMTPEGLRLRATLRGPSWAVLNLYASESFRELVVFTPPHRQAFCVEPYTCTTDAINLEARGIPAGWRVLAPGERWTSVVELRVD
jgi:aldose 1-epimerase